MKFWVGVIDNRGFEFLAERRPDEVNIWQPNGARAFGAIKPGEPFLFKLHSPENFIVGGGLFVRHTFLPLSMAWETFGENNGAPDYQTFAWLIRKYREPRGTMEPDPTIGCIVLSGAFFFPRPKWIPTPGDWSPNLVQGKTYDTEDATGADLWNTVRERLSESSSIAQQLGQLPLVFSELTQYGSEHLGTVQVGGGAFRVLVSDAYQRCCAITGERALPALQATHIRPLARSGPNNVSNGILLRADLRMLFDNGYLTITEDHRVTISRRLRDFNSDGGAYAALHGASLAVLPLRESDQPLAEHLRWHGENVFM